MNTVELSDDDLRFLIELCECSHDRRAWFLRRRLDEALERPAAVAVVVEVES